jgi:hypothetical protein
MYCGHWLLSSRSTPAYAASAPNDSCARPSPQPQHRPGVENRMAAVWGSAMEYGCAARMRGRQGSAPAARKLWGLFFVCCLYSVDVMQNCEGSLPRDKFLF